MMMTSSSGSESTSLPDTPRHHVTLSLNLRSCSVDPVSSDPPSPCLSSSVRSSDASPDPSFSSFRLLSSRDGWSKVSPSDIVRLADNKLRRQRAAAAAAARRHNVLMTLGNTSARPTTDLTGAGQYSARTRGRLATTRSLTCQDLGLTGSDHNQARTRPVFCMTC